MKKTEFVHVITWFPVRFNGSGLRPCCPDLYKDTEKELVPTLISLQSKNTTSND